MSNTETNLAPLRIEQHEPIRLAGFARQFTDKSMNEIPDLWRNFGTRIVAISNPAGSGAYGVSYGRADDEEGFAYIVGVEVNDASVVPDDFDTLKIPALQMAVFPHDGDVSELSGTIHLVWTEWLPESGYQFDERGRGGIYQIERYTDAFDPASGRGGMEIWIPVSRKP